MKSPRPTTRGTGMTAFSNPTSYEEEEDGDDGMFSYLPPSTSQGGPATFGTFQRSAQATGNASLQAPVPVLLRTDSRADSPSLFDGASAAAHNIDPEKAGIAGGHASAMSSPDPNQRSPAQAMREFQQGYTINKHVHHVPATATTFSSEGSPIIELNEHMRMARMASTASNSSEKLGEENKSILAPGTAISTTYTEAMARLNELDPEEEDSPYPEVRASVSNVDDPEMPSLTFRAWVIGLVLSMAVGALNQYFSLRQPSPFLTPILVLIVSYPIGKLFARYLPIRTFKTPVMFQRLGMEEEWSFNPGPFNVKEHAVITIMANTAAGYDYALFMTLTLDKFYNLPRGPGFDILLVLSNQIIGFGFAGLCRRFLVWPASIIWPQNLVFCTMYNTLHAEDDDGSDGSMTRYRFFLWVFGIAGIWWWLPGYLFTATSFFSWICWIAPTNVVVNQIFGVISGLGASALTFDWIQISYIGSPLVVPWWAEVNVFVGFCFFMWFLTPIFYYTNLWFFAYMPIASEQVFDRFGNPYNATSILGADGTTFDEAAYLAYSPLYLPVSFVSIYSIAFCLSTAVIVHTGLYHGPMLWRRLRKFSSEPEDIHAKLMRNYAEVPEWWYMILLGVTFVLAIVAIEVYDTGLPVWGLVLSILLAAIYTLPSGFIYGQTAIPLAINLLAELLPGYMLPGKPIAVMTFKIFSIQGLYAATNFIQDLKLGHYMKVPPRVTFMTQLAAALVSSLVQIGVKYWLLHDVDDLCSPDQSARLICPVQQVFYSSSIIWGVIGPMRQFSPGALYHPLVYWALIGAILPLPFWLLARRYPNSWYRFVNIPVLLTGCTFIPAATGFNYASWFLVAFVFQYWIRRRHFRWWSKFNFVLSAGLDGATLVTGILIFLCLELPDNGNITLNWWGNDVWQNTADFNGTSYLTPPADGFGPTTWT